MEVGSLSKSTIWSKGQTSFRTSKWVKYFSILVVILVIGVLSIGCQPSKKPVKKTRNTELAKQHLDKGSKFYGKGEWNKAIREFKKALTNDPEDVSARFQLARTYETIGYTDGAITQYREIVKLQPKSADAHYNMGVALRRKGKLEESIEHLEKAVELNSNLVGAHFDLARTYFAREMYDQALAEYNKTLLLTSDDIYKAAIHNAIAEVYLRQGMKDRAVAEWREALRLYPQSREAQENLQKYGE